MFSIEIECPPAERDLVIAELWENGSAGMAELDNGRLRVFFEDDADRAGLAKRFQVVSWREEEPRDWVTISRALFEPLTVGARFFLVPEWRDDPAPAGRFRIAVNPGMAFGTGFHETTQLCIEALEMLVSPGVSVLDIGTGSGILAQAATLLGATGVWACDIDGVAVEIARDVARVDAFVGSVDAVRSGCADVLTANISPEAITQLAPELLRCLSPSGVALLSGFERHEEAAVGAALERWGGVIGERRFKGNWAMIEVTAPPGAPQRA